jgi:alpha-glucuronidase
MMYSAARSFRLATVLWCAFLAPLAWAEDGYDLWLRYPQAAPEALQRYRAAVTHIVGSAESSTLQAVKGELERGLAGVLGSRIPVETQVTRPGAVIFGTPASSSIIAEMKLPLNDAGSEGYVLRSVNVDGRPASVIAANTEIGVLYGAFHFLRLLQTEQPIDIGTISIATSSAATPVSRCGIGTSCRTTSIRDTRTMRARTRRSASMAPCSRT